MSKFPFNRLLVQDFFYSDLGNLTISGKLITEYFHNGIAEDGHTIFEHDTVEANPHIFKEEFLIRGRLETVSDEALDYLLSTDRDIDEIVRGLQILREFLWESWDLLIKDYIYMGDDPECFFTGIDYAKSYKGSYRNWEISSDPLDFIDFIKDDGWLTKKIWRTEKTWSLAEIYALLSLWCVDESIAHLEKGYFYKSVTWFGRAISSKELIYVSQFEESESDISIKKVARLDGLGRSKKYQPLRERAFELVKSKKWQSRRNAVKTITPEILGLAKTLNIPLCSGQLIPDTRLSFSSVTAGANPSLN